MRVFAGSEHRVPPVEDSLPPPSQDPLLPPPSHGWRTGSKLQLVKVCFERTEAVCKIAFRVVYLAKKGGSWTAMETNARSTVLDADITADSSLPLVATAFEALKGIRTYLDLRAEGVRWEPACFMADLADRLQLRRLNYELKERLKSDKNTFCEEMAASAESAAPSHTLQKLRALGVMGKQKRKGTRAMATMCDYNSIFVSIPVEVL